PCTSGAPGGGTAPAQPRRPGPSARWRLLQVRTRVINDNLADDFRRWHPGFTHTSPDRDEMVSPAA
ncbi:MAG: hypothetical protein ACRDZY_13855, partial [Acidimicrobiales bacterium]